ncbi:hypothetical protein [Paenibacillus abyssi]|nr:hypothetical protein [Paenibacillus abyssi]
MKFDKVVFNHTCENKSDRFVIVGNCSEFISDHSTIEEAQSALSDIHVGESKWAKVQILEPGESASLSGLERTIYPKVKYDESMFDLGK